MSALSLAGASPQATATPVIWSLYLIRCKDGTLYTGISTDVDRRFQEHASGGPRAARYLRGKQPLELVFQIEAGDRSSASQLEWQVKQLSRTDKLKLIAGKLTLQGRSLPAGDNQC